jgi:hypothetical protein
MLFVMIVGCGSPSSGQGIGASSGARDGPGAAAQTMVAGQPLGPTDPSTVGLDVQSEGFDC